MFEQIKEFFGFSSIEEKAARYDDLKKSFVAYEHQIDDLAKEFCIQKSLYDQRMLDPDNYIIQGRIEEKFQDFLKGHKDNIRLAKKYFDSAKKELNTIENSLLNHKSIRKQPDGKGGWNFMGIEKAHTNILGEYGEQCLDTIEEALKNPKQTAYEKLKKAYHSGIVSPEQLEKAIKGITKDKKTKYSDFILFNEKGQILLTQRSTWESSNAGAWVIPGGHVDPNESHADAAVRELREETGYNVDKVTHAGDFEDDHVGIEYFIGQVNTTEQVPVVQWEEVRDVRWIDLDELNDYEMVFNMAANVKKILGVKDRVKTRISKTV